MSRITPPAKRAHARHRPLSPRRLDQLIEQAIVDAYGPEPPPTGWEWIEAYRRWARGAR